MNFLPCRINARIPIHVGAGRGRFLGWGHLISLLNFHSPGLNPEGMCFTYDNLYQDGTENWQLDVDHWIFSLFPCYSLLFPAIPCYSPLFPAIPCYSLLIPATPSSSLLFLPLPCYSLLLPAEETSGLLLITDLRSKLPHKYHSHGNLF